MREEMIRSVMTEFEANCGKVNITVTIEKLLHFVEILKKLQSFLHNLEVM